MKEQDNAAYYDKEQGQFYTITWFDTGNNEIPTRHYIDNNSSQIDCQVKPANSVIGVIDEMLEHEYKTLKIYKSGVLCRTAIEALEELKSRLSV